MTEINVKPLIVFDDRLQTTGSIARYVGKRSYGSIRVRNQSVYERFVDALPDWAKTQCVRIDRNNISANFNDILPDAARHESILVVEASAAIIDARRFEAFVDRLALSEYSILSDQQAPKFMFVSTRDDLKSFWEAFAENSLKAGIAALNGQPPLQISDADQMVADITELSAFLNFITGATSMRSFNSAEFDELTYVKKSADKRKIRAEHDFCNLVPSSVRPWLVGTFDYQDHPDFAQYSMRRYLFADAAFQWVHNAWDEKEFREFLFRISHFLSIRPAADQPVDKLEIAKNLLIEKVKTRRDQLYASEVGLVAKNLLANTLDGKRFLTVFDEYLELAEKHLDALAGSEMVVGHGDPCLSNILYDPATKTMKLIDPKGGSKIEDLWTISTYDYFKLSHSVLGNYDFINNLLFSIELDANGAIQLKYSVNPDTKFKSIFSAQMSTILPIRMLRLGEASLFLSMLPLHADYLNKVIAFWVRGREILDRVKDKDKSKYDS